MKILVLAILTTARCLTATAQGTVNFINVTVTVGLNAPVYHSDGVNPLSGPQFQAELLGGASASNMVSIATTGFLEGTGAGYFNGDTQTVPNVPGGGIAWVEVEVWNTASGNTFAQAHDSGLPDSWWQSSVFTVSTGCPYCYPPSAPALLIGLGNSPVFLNRVPEPSRSAFAALAVVAFVLHSREHKISTRSKGI